MTVSGSNPSCSGGCSKPSSSSLKRSIACTADSVSASRSSRASSSSRRYCLGAQRRPRTRQSIRRRATGDRGAPGPESTVHRSIRRTTIALRVLVIDDNHEAADILRHALEHAGHVIAIAYDGPSALEIAKTHAPQIALVDIGLPVMDGYHVASLLRAEYAIPLVAITGYGQASDRERALASGFAAHMVKPVDLGELTDLVERLGRLIAD